MLYQKNSAPALLDGLFQNPTAEYRGAPFWAWNCRLNKPLLKRQIGYLKEMGFGGFHMHSRVGMDTTYLSDAFMELVKCCTAEAKEKNMLSWLYDEDRWPSGAAGGLVTKEKKYRAKRMVLSVHDRTDDLPKEEALPNGRPYFAAAYDICLNPDGSLRSYTRIGRGDRAKGVKWYAFVHINEDDPWYNNQAYVDTLDEAAMKTFIDITYESYKHAVGDEFGKAVPAIFTDEPQFSIVHRNPAKRVLDFADEQCGVCLVWSTDFVENFQHMHGYDILDKLPEVVWTLANNKPSKVKYDFYNFATECFVSAFGDQCGRWCEAHGIAFTGHVVEEDSLRSQTHAVGEAMRFYRSFTIPGIDMLSNHRNFNTAKQAQSVAHQFGKEGVLSELYGVTNWDFDFRGHKFQGDWQAALGITVRVPHLSWVSMAGEAKRDYPASINYQSPWYREYPYVEDHFARLNTALTRGKPVVKTAVIHPIESYWINVGPNDIKRTICEKLDKNFEDVTNWLLGGHIDFDFISESLLPGLCKTPGNPLPVGSMAYRSILVAGCETLRRTTFDALSAFLEAGGNLVFAGPCPKYIDAAETGEVRALYEKSVCVDLEEIPILDALACERLVDIRDADGKNAGDLIYNMRQDGDCKWIFIAHSAFDENVDITPPREIVIKLKGEYAPVLYDTITGEISPIPYTLKDGWTVICRTIYSHDSLLLKLTAPGAPVLAPETAAKTPDRVIDFKTAVPYTLAEPNALLLDLAEYALDGGDFRPMEEILRLDNALRDELNWPPKRKAQAQPWTMEEEPITHSITLRFAFQSEIGYAAPSLAIEDAETLAITFNGKPVAPNVTGYYVDEAIKTVPLPPIVKGENTLVVKIPFGRRTNTEWCYVLGDFGVRVCGCEKTIIQKPKTVGFSSITDQGMPFYGGNITYQTELETDDCDLVIDASSYRGALVRVAIDGKDAGRVVYAPYTLKIDGVKKGRHTVEFTLFGNRFNTFGALHCNNPFEEKRWAGPQLWRLEGDSWCYEYRLKNFGILRSPIISVYNR